MNWCKDCAIRLFNTKHYNLQGVGNPWCGKCIIIPNVDYNAYKHGNMSFSMQVKLIESILLSSTGVEYSDLYIVPLIRCNEYISCPLDNASYFRCLRYFIEDIKMFDFTDILLLGSAAKRFLSIEISSYLDTVLISPNNRRYAVNYSPFIGYTNKKKFEVFKQHLIKWYNAVSYNDFSDYNIQRLDYDNNCNY